MASNKNSRKSFAFSTPQVPRAGPSQPRFSMSDVEDEPDKPPVKETFLSNKKVDKQPLLDVMKKKANNNRPSAKKKRFESPTTTQFRRRALKAQDTDSLSSDELLCDDLPRSSAPFHHLLKGIVAYVEIMSNDQDKSGGVKALLTSMGARIVDKISRGVTHVIFQDGSFETRCKANLVSAHLVSALWVEAVRRNHCKVREDEYPALDTQPFNANISDLCEQFQRECDDVDMELINGEIINRQPSLDLTGSSMGSVVRETIEAVNAKLKDFDSTGSAEQSKLDNSSQRNSSVRKEDNSRSSSRRKKSVSEQSVKKIVHGKQSKQKTRSSIVCSRFHRPEVRTFQQIVTKLGGFNAENEVTAKTSHLVISEPKRTVNLLRAIARGCWILKAEWLYRSLEAGKWLQEEDYELTDYSSAVQQSRQQRQAFGPSYSMDVFNGCGNIYIAKSSNPRCSDLQELVTLCKGKITKILRNAKLVVGEYLERDDVTCVSENWILDSITFYKKMSLTSYLIEPPPSRRQSEDF